MTSLSDEKDSPIGCEQNYDPAIKIITPVHSIVPIKGKD